MNGEKIKDGGLAFPQPDAPFTKAELDWYRLRNFLHLDPSNFIERPIDPPPPVYWRIISLVSGGGNLA